MYFAKYQGLGNDFILIDNRSSSKLLLSSEQILKMCNRHFGIGADGIIFVLAGNEISDYGMRIFNSDGSEPEMCGNGIRCLVSFISTLEKFEKTSKTYKISTLAGIISAELQTKKQVKVEMGIPLLLNKQIPTTLKDKNNTVINYPLEIEKEIWPVTCINIGNPHCVTFIKNSDLIDLEKLGPLFEHHSAFPERINTEFVEVIRSNYLKMRVWERGAGATLACGTGACASVVAGVVAKKNDRICTVELPGGCLSIEWMEDNGKVYMTGSAEEVFTGQYTQ
ncbi:MAG: diaminopimelate epimerase [Candidatus Atelocyanobacterium thalassa isolate SIO64986]|uniref:Diaminopimelate epimerase n=1 Tax=Candidatus Atelocyanobacterium thalassa isolate SIO64986 TaxID=1527444 RepID=A0A086CIU1_9CHRO|nr:MAG: diaminopimelate epimerase [Candidatus Atelocyanobacterium thalassa isolate SIO64986]